MRTIFFCLLAMLVLSSPSDAAPSPHHDPVATTNFAIAELSMYLVLASLPLVIGNSVAIANGGDRGWAIAGIVGGTAITVLSGFLVAPATDPAVSGAVLGVSITAMSLGALSLTLGILSLYFDLRESNNRRCVGVPKRYRSHLQKAQRNKASLQALQQMEKDQWFCFVSTEGRKLLNERKRILPPRHKTPPSPKGSSRFLTFD